MTNKLYTLGYENAAVNDFIATLKAVDIEKIIDIREYPLSRKKGFSKGILRSLLEANNIGYVHLKGLGDPKQGREAARAGDYEEFQRIFAHHMESALAVADLEKAIKFASSSVSCLLCYERDPAECHRTIVARAIAADTGQATQPIGVQKGIAHRERFQPIYPHIFNV